VDTSGSVIWGHGGHSRLFSWLNAPGTGSLRQIRLVWCVFEGMFLSWAQEAEVACVAARRQLGLLADEAEVRDFANAYGYEYVPRRAACSTRLLPLDVATA
jgi:hypothetical protein